MGLPWIKVSVDLPSHPKLQHLESLLPGMDGLAIIIRLWTWAAKYAPDGSFPAHLSVAAGSAVTRDGSVSHAKVLEALITSRWIERGELIWIIHDWRVFQGALVTITEKNRKRQRKHRRAAKLALGHGSVTHDVTPLSRVEKRGEEKRGDLLTTLSNSLNSTGEVLQILSPPGKPLTDAERVFAHWQRVMRKPRAVLDGTRERLIKARLEDYSVEQLCRAIDGYSRDAFSMGKNDRDKAYNGINLICRDAAHVEQFMPPAPATGPPPEKRKTEAEIAAEVNREFEAKHGGI